MKFPAFAVALTIGIIASPALAQLRIVTYNTLRDADPTAATVLQGIGEENVEDIARPVDILMLQEQEEPFTTTQGFVDILNDLYGEGVYARGSVVTGPSFSSIRQSVVYNTQTVQLLEETDIARTSVAGNTPPREALRAKFRPVGYDERSDFYVYNSHFKAGSSSSDIARRGAEAVNLRNDADALGDDAHVIFLGDFNLRNDGSSTGLSNPAEPAFQTLVGPGAAQAFDPVADIAPAQWKNNSAARFVHTHGRNDVDDRFDFQLPSTEFADGEGLDLIDGTYRVFGNNGSTYNRAVNSSTNTYDFNFAPDSTLDRQDVLDAIFTASDHLPVVADYQLPAIFSASLETTPSFFVQGQLAEASLLVENTANVIAPSGADELDYTLTWAGDNIGSLIDSDLADGLAKVHLIPLDTSTPGTFSTDITLTSDSQGVVGLDAFGERRFTLNYTVLPSSLTGDFNADGLIDAADYTVWRDAEGTAVAQGAGGDANGDGLIDGADLAVWSAAYGNDAFFLASNTVPEPAALLATVFALVQLGICRPQRVV